MKQVLMRVHSRVRASKIMRGMFFSLLPFYGLACLQFPTEDFLVGDMRLTYSVLAENMEEVTVSVRLHDMNDIYFSDLTVSEGDALYVEHDGDSYLLDEEDTSKFMIPDVLYTKTIPYFDSTKPFTLTFDRPSGEYKTDVFLPNDFSVSVQNDEVFAFSSEQFVPVDVRWTPVLEASGINIGLRDTDCAGFPIESVENTGQAQIEIRLDEPVVSVGPMDRLCTVNVYVSAHTVGNSVDFGESYIRGYQRRSSFFKVLYLP